jgi:hypothetical protein
MAFQSPSGRSPNADQFVRNNRSRSDFFKLDTDIPEPARPSFGNPSLVSQPEESNLSLQQYISQHIEKQSAEQESASSEPGSVSGQFETVFSGKKGIQLNNIDTQTPKGIEQLLPSPWFRLNITRERLARDIQTLESRINQYKQVEAQTTDLVERTQMLERRLHMLQRQEAQVAYEMDYLMTKGPLSLRITQGVNNFKQKALQAGHNTLAWVSPSALIKRANPASEVLAEYNRHLVGLKDVLAEHPAPNASEIGDLINEYDRMLRQVETLADAIRNRPSFWYVCRANVQKWQRQIASAFEVL